MSSIRFHSWFHHLIADTRFRPAPSNGHELDLVVDPDQRQGAIQALQGDLVFEPDIVRQGPAVILMKGEFIRTIGLIRAKVKISLMNLTYNLMRYLQLTTDRDGAPAVA